MPGAAAGSSGRYDWVETALLMPSKTLLILSQVYVPDPASVGQHMHDAAAEMARRGYRVRVLTSARGYEDPTRKYAPRERLDGVQIRRLPLSSFGKASVAVRLVGGSIFLVQAMVHGLFTSRLAGILVSTSPPMCSVAALFIRMIRRVPVKYWAMDINPDQMILMGRIRKRSIYARAFELLNRLILRGADNVIALDRYMADRLYRKCDVRRKTSIIAPWPHVIENDPPVEHEDNPFRKQHRLNGKFVIMYSGNISPAHPITTIVDAALKLRDDPRLMFLFIGGGLGRREIQSAIDKHAPPMIRLLPYQPLDGLRFSLSAADVHLVSVGDKMVGVVHPCKVYGAMAVGRPILLLGPEPCHVSDIVEAEQIGWRIPRGDVDGAVTVIRQIAGTDPDELQQMGRRARDVVSRRFSKACLCAMFGDVLEQNLRPDRTGQLPGPAV